MHYVRLAQKAKLTILAAELARLNKEPERLEACLLHADIARNAGLSTQVREVGQQIYDYLQQIKPS